MSCNQFRLVVLWTCSRATPLHCTLDGQLVGMRPKTDTTVGTTSLCKTFAACNTKTDSDSADSDGLQQDTQHV